MGRTGRRGDDSVTSRTSRPFPKSGGSTGSGPTCETGMPVLREVVPWGLPVRPHPVTSWRWCARVGPLGEEGGKVRGVRHGSPYSTSGPPWSSWCVWFYHSLSETFNLIVTLVSGVSSDPGRTIWICPTDPNFILSSQRIGLPVLQVLWYPWVSSMVLDPVSGDRTFFY